MDTSEDFKAAIPEPYQILGLRLLPLSLGRYRLLHRFNCAFVAEGEASATMADLLWGVAICSLRCDEFLKLYESGEIFDDFKQWAKRISARPTFDGKTKDGKKQKHPILHCIWRILFGKRWRKNHSFNFVEKMKLFQNYILEAQKIPEYQTKGGDGRGSTAHWSTSVEIILRGELGWTIEEINEAPLTKALSDYFKHLEHQGLVTIFTEEDLDNGKSNTEALMAALKGQHGS